MGTTERLVLRYALSDGRIAEAFCAKFSVQLRFNLRGGLHRAFPRKRHQARHLVGLHRLVRRQTLYPTELRAQPH